MNGLSGTKAGITGHQDLPAKDWVREALNHLIRQEGIERGVTSLARGADQLYAECLLEAGRSYCVVVPSAHYEDAFDDVASREAYEHLLSRAIAVQTLAFDKPSEAAFFAAGKHIVDEVALVIAVWDGAPARGLGGTGDVVQYAKSRGKSVIHLNCQTRTISRV